MVRDVKGLLERKNCVITGHYGLDDGFHARDDINTTGFLVDPYALYQLGEAMAQKFQHKDIQAVIAAGLKNHSLAVETAKYLGVESKAEVLAVYCERKERLILKQDTPRHTWILHTNLADGNKREVEIITDAGLEVGDELVAKESQCGFREDVVELIRGKTVLIVTDLVEKGTTVVSVASETEKLNCKIKGVVSVCQIGHKLGGRLSRIPLTNLAHFNFTAWPTEKCPICKKNLPLTTRNSLA